MRAMVFTRPGFVENLDVDEPEVGPGDSLVTVAAAGICGSELHGIGSPGFRQPPLIMGHEFAGTTADGRRVVINPVVSCGTCDICARGLDQLCRTRNIVGIHRSGGFAERSAVPESQLHEIPDSMSWLAAALVEPFANGLHAWDLAGRPAGARVGVIGAGTIGLVSYEVARRDAAEVVVAELAPDRRAVATAAGANAVERLEGEFDVIIDAVGSGATRAISVDLLRPGGTAVWLGLLGPEAGFDGQALIRLGKRVIGSFAYPDRTFAEAITLTAQQDVSWARPFSLEEGPDVFLRLAAGDTDVVKAVLQPATVE